MTEETQTQETQEAPPTGGGQEPSGETPTSVEGEGRKPDVSASNGKKRENDSLAYLVRKQLESSRSLEQRFTALESKFSTNGSAGNGQPAAAESIDVVEMLTDRSKFEDAVGKVADSRVQKILNQEKLQDAVTVANEYVYSQGDITEDDYPEIQKIAENNGLYPVLAKNPELFGKMAVSLWREARGLPSPDSAKRTSAKMQAGGVGGTTTDPAAGGKRVWTRKEIDEVSRDINAWRKHEVDILAAYKDGRIRG